MVPDNGDRIPMPEEEPDGQRNEVNERRWGEYSGRRVGDSTRGTDGRSERRRRVGHATESSSLLKDSVEMPQGLKPSKTKKGFIAALKALRHPKPSFSANC